METLSGESLRYRFLSETDAERLYRENPDLGSSPEEYCPTCQKSGYYVWKGKKHECDCQLQLQLHKHYLSSGIGVTYQRLGWEDLRNPNQGYGFCELYLKHMKDFVHQGQGFMFRGDNGTGKTMLSMLLLKELIKSNYTVYATTSSSMIEMFTSGWKDLEDKRRFQEKMVHS